MHLSAPLALGLSRPLKPFECVGWRPLTLTLGPEAENGHFQYNPSSLPRFRHTFRFSFPLTRENLPGTFDS